MDTLTPTRATEPLRAEHRELLPHIDAIHEVADAIGHIDDVATWQRLGGVHEFLSEHLVPHARAEEAALYPAVEAAMRAPGATDTMRRDHVEVLARIEQLRGELADRDPITDATAARLRAELYGLQAILTLHFAKEEEIYLPILDSSLSPIEATELFRRLEAAASA